MPDKFKQKKAVLILLKTGISAHYSEIGRINY